MWFDTLLFGASGPIRNGQNIPTYDGVNFFSASHPSNYYAGNAVNVNQSNYVSSGGALTADSLTSARAAMMSFVGPDSLPLGVVPDTLLVPPSLYTVGMQLTTADMLAMQSFGGISQVGGSSNVLKGLLNVVETPLLSGDPTAWYLLDTGARGGLGGSIRPFIVQNRQAPVVVQKFNAQDENVYRYNAFEWGADIRGQVSQSHWFLAYKSVA
jgi:phage major head subunit gpT-like protein